MSTTGDPQENTDDKTHDSQDGQVSEMARGGEQPVPISSGDSVAGQPEQESGEVDEGAQGPDAIPDDPTGEHPHKP